MTPPDTSPSACLEREMTTLDDDSVTSRLLLEGIDSNDLGPIKHENEPSFSSVGSIGSLSLDDEDFLLSWPCFDDACNIVPSPEEMKRFSDSPNLRVATLLSFYGYVNEWLIYELEH